MRHLLAAAVLCVTSTTASAQCIPGSAREIVRFTVDTFAINLATQGEPDAVQHGNAPSLYLIGRGHGVMGDRSYDARVVFVPSAVRRPDPSFDCKVGTTSVFYDIEAYAAVLDLLRTKGRVELVVRRRESGYAASLAGTRTARQ